MRKRLHEREVPAVIREADGMAEGKGHLIVERLGPSQHGDPPVIHLIVVDQYQELTVVEVETDEFLEACGLGSWSDWTDGETTDV